jgi:hypothetical protein
MERLIDGILKLITSERAIMQNVMVHIAQAQHAQRIVRYCNMSVLK